MYECYKYEQHQMEVNVNFCISSSLYHKLEINQKQVKVSHLQIQRETSTVGCINITGLNQRQSSSSCMKEYNLHYWHAYIPSNCLGYLEFVNGHKQPWDKQHEHSSFVEHLLLYVLWLSSLGSTGATAGRKNVASASKLYFVGNGANWCVQKGYKPAAKPDIYCTSYTTEKNK